MFLPARILCFPEITSEIHYYKRMFLEFPGFSGSTNTFENRGQRGGGQTERSNWKLSEKLRSEESFFGCGQMLVAAAAGVGRHTCLWLSQSPSPLVLRMRQMESEGSDPVPGMLLQSAQRWMPKVGAWSQGSTGLCPSPAFPNTRVNCKQTEIILHNTYTGTASQWRK